MKMNEAALFNLPDVLIYRKIKVWLCVSPISVELEIRYEEFKWPRYVKRHQERGAVISF